MLDGSGMWTGRGDTGVNVLPRYSGISEGGVEVIYANENQVLWTNV